MVVALVVLQLAAADGTPQITLAEALRRATVHDPSYVAAEGAVDNAHWSRRAALSSLFLPSISASSDASRFSAPTFNLGTARPEDISVSARLDARYDVFLGGRKLAELRRSRAALERAEALEVEARYDLALRTERDFYQALADQELERVAGERVRRAEEQLVIARARVTSGAAVSTDSLQLLLELSGARVALLEQTTALRVARLQLGRRVGLDGPAQPVETDSLSPADLPITLDQAVAEARARGPSFVAARADEDAAEALVRAERGLYFPQVSVFASSSAFDDRFFPQATTRSAITLSMTLPIWNNGQREVAVEQARVMRQVARVARRDQERAAERDLTEAYEAYSNARATERLRREALLVARENYRVQDTRYRAGATTILDLLAAQAQLTEGEANLVQADFAARLALAELEAILGRRLFGDRTTP
ncbi:MAG: TolC family protein [Gemmatimonadota bacterium]|nr:TolC family protein [Gemmatimonadota bacterium]